MKRVLALLAMVFLATVAHAQTGAVNGLCSLGGTQATTSGLKSANYLNGVIPSCTVTVYLTGTTTLATIYADSNSTPLANPFTANSISSVNPGGWIFWAATNQGLDVTMSGGISPNTYPQPVTLTDIFPSQSFSPVSGVTKIIAGTDITISPSGGTGNVTINSNGGSSFPTCATNQMLYYAADGSTATCLSLGTNLGISAGQLNATGGGSGSGVLPSTAAVELVSSSIIDDDGASLSPLITAAGWSCNGTTCDVNTTTAHGLSVGSYAYVFGLTGWFSTPTNLYPYDYGVAVFKVATVPSSTEFTFAYTANTGSGSGGNIRDASYWGSYQMFNANFLSGGATYQYRFSSLADLDTYFSTKVNCSLGSPTYLVIEVGQNDVFNGDSEATLEAHFESVWAKAHAAGCVMMQGTILPANFGSFASTAMWKTINDLNVWIRKQPWQYTLASSNQYWDHLIDYATDEYDQDNESLGPRLQHDFPQRTNDAFSHLGDSETGPPPIFMAYGSGSSNSIGFAPQRYDYLDTSGNSVFHLDYRDSQNFAVFNNTAGGNTPRLVPEYAVGGLSDGVCKPFGRSVSNAFMLCYVYVNSSTTSPLNYISLISRADNNWDPANEIWRLYADGTLQFLHYTAGSGTQPLAVDTTGKVSVGTRQWSCQPGLGDGLNAITSGTYLQTTCKNTTGSTVTITGIQCYADGGTPTMNVTNGAGTGLLTGAITCTSSYAAGTQSATTTLANGDYLKFTFVAGGTAKQTSWVVQGTY